MPYHTAESNCTECGGTVHITELSYEDELSGVEITCDNKDCGFHEIHEW